MTGRQSAPAALRIVSAPRLCPRARSGSTSNDGSPVPASPVASVGLASLPVEIVRAIQSTQRSSSSSSGGLEPPLAISSTTPSSSIR